MTSSDASFPQLILFPRYGATVERIAPVDLMAMGDGYEVRSPSRREVYEVWNIEAVLTDEEYEVLEAQLKQFGGAQAFIWHPRNQSTEKAFKCRQWSRIHLAPDVNSFQARFEQVVERLVLYYVNAGADIYNFCASVIDLIGDSNASRVQWQQIAGESVNLVGASTLFAQFDRSGKTGPFTFRLSVSGQQAFDDVKVYTTPTSDFDGMGLGANLFQQPACRAVPCNLSSGALIFRQHPVGLQGFTYIPKSMDGRQEVTWNLPTCDTEYLTEMVWQSNTTGKYIDEQSFTKNDIRFFKAEQNKHYHILSKYNVFGTLSQKASCTFYITSDLYPASNKGLADDNINGISLSSSSYYIRFELIRKGFEDALDGISLGSKVSTYIRNTWIRKDNEDSLNGISLGAAVTSYQRQNFTGVIIG